MSRDEYPTCPEIHIPAAVLVGVTCTEWTPPRNAIRCPECDDDSLAEHDGSAFVCPECGWEPGRGSRETPGAVPLEEMPEIETKRQCRGCGRSEDDCTCCRHCGAAFSVDCICNDP